MLSEGTLIRNAMTIPGTTMPKELAFLCHVARLAPTGGYFVELGTYQGRTAAVLAYAAVARGARVATIDDYSYTQASSPKVVRGHMDRLGLAVSILRGDSRVVPDGIAHVHLLHVDSNHTRAHFDAEMAAWLPLLPVGGIVACHDYDSPKWVEMTGAIQAHLFNSQWERLGLVRRMIAFRRLA